MEVLQIISGVLSVFSFTAAMVFVVHSFIELRKIRRKQEHTLMIVIGEHIRNNFTEVNELKKTFRQLIDSEQFEEANKLKMFIADKEEKAMNAMNRFKETYGDAIGEISVTQIKYD